MASRWYPGFCEKYGVVKAHVAAHGIPMGLYALAACFNGAAKADIQAEAMRGLAVSFPAMFAAAAVNIGLNLLVLRNRGVGKTRGGQIVRACQAAIYAVPVAAGLVFNGLGDGKPGLTVPRENSAAALSPAIPPVLAKPLGKQPGFPL